MSDFSFLTTDRLTVLLVVLGAADHPIIGYEGLFAARLVFLSHEGLLVGQLFAQVGCAGCNGCAYCGEARTYRYLTVGQRSGTLHFSAEVQTVTVF